jgi:hypothetical protein
VEPFEAALQYETRDWIRAYRRINASMPNARRVRLLGPVFCFVLGFALSGGGSDGLSSGTTMALIVALIGLAAPYVQAFQTMRIHRDVPGGGVVTVRIDADGVTTRNGGASNHIDWTAVTGITETDFGIIIEIGRKGGRVVLPSRLLSSDQLAAANAWLHQRQQLVASDPMSGA